MLIVFLFSLIKVIMWIIDNNNTNDIIKKVANTYEINEKSYDNMSLAIVRCGKSRFSW